MSSRNERPCPNWDCSACRKHIAFLLILVAICLGLLATVKPTSAECNSLSCWGSCLREADCGRDCRCVRFSSEREGFCRST